MEKSSAIVLFMEWLGNLVMDLLVLASAFIKWIGVFFMTNPWPAITLIMIILVFFIPWTRFVIKDLVKSLGLKRLKFSGTEIEFIQEDKLVIQRTFEESFEIIRQYRRKVEKNIARLNRKIGLRAAFVEAAAAIFEKQFGSKFGRDGMRATIHVLDFVFEDRLYQITGYYPDGGGIHRHLSLRKGIIGRVWRSQIATSAGYLIDRVANSSYSSPDETIEEICREWGLTETEAYGYQKKPSYCCVPIKDGHRMLGVFYMDCEKSNFGWKRHERNKIESKLNELEACCTDELRDKKIPMMLSEIENAMADYAPRRSFDE